MEFSLKKVEESEIITQKPKYIETLNINDIKSELFIEHSKTSDKLSETISVAENNNTGYFNLL